MATIPTTRTINPIRNISVISGGTIGARANTHMADEGYIREQQTTRNIQRSVAEGVTRATDFGFRMSDEFKELNERRQQAKRDVDKITYMNGMRDVASKSLEQIKTIRDPEEAQKIWNKNFTQYTQDFKKVNSVDNEFDEQMFKQASQYYQTVTIQSQHTAIKNDSKWNLSRIQASNADIITKSNVNNFETDLETWRQNKKVEWKYTGEPAKEVQALEEQTFARQYFVNSYSKVIDKTPVDAIDPVMWQGNKLLDPKDKNALDTALNRKKYQVAREERDNMDKYVEKNIYEPIYDSLKTGQPLQIEDATFDEIAKHDAKTGVYYKQMVERIKKPSTTAMKGQDAILKAQASIILNNPALSKEDKRNKVQTILLASNTPQGADAILKMADTNKLLESKLDAGEKTIINSLCRDLHKGFGADTEGHFLDPEEANSEAKGAYEYGVYKQPYVEDGGWFWFDQKAIQDPVKSSMAATSLSNLAISIAVALKDQGKPVTIDSVMKAGLYQERLKYARDLYQTDVLKKYPRIDSIKRPMATPFDKNIYGESE